MHSESYGLGDDNEITILQEGDNFELDITLGYDNIIKQWTSSVGNGVDDDVSLNKQEIEVTEQRLKCLRN